MIDDKVLIGLATTAFFLLMRWLNAKINRETEALEKSLKYLDDSLKEEKQQTVWRVDEIYKRVDSHRTEFHKRIDDSEKITHQCRKELDNKMSSLMTESQVKDFVDRSIKPLSDDMRSTKQTVNEVKESNSQIHADIRVMNTLLSKYVEDK